MKAVIPLAYGPAEVLQLKEVNRPSPRDNEVLVKIYASTVTMGDCELRGLTLPLWTRIPMRMYMGYTRPKRWRPGMEYSGVVESIGESVKNFKLGDEVFGSSGMSMGANAEYKCFRSTSAMAIKPNEVTFDEAATIPVGGLNALHFLRKANIQPGQKVLVIGAGGSIGTYGVQLAKLFGGVVTAVDRTDKLDMLTRIGADHVIDYTKEHFTRSGIKYDVVFDMVYHSDFSACFNVTTETGCYLMANPSPVKMLRAIWLSLKGSRKVIFEFAGDKVGDLEYIAGLIASKKIEAVIDRRYTLDQIVDAHRYVEMGNKKGSVVILNRHSPN